MIDSLIAITLAMLIVASGALIELCAGLIADMIMKG